MTTFQPGDVSAFTAAFASVARALADAADPPLSPQAILARHPAPPVSEGDALAKAFADYESTREDVARRTDPMRANSLLLAGAGLANAVKDHLVQLQVQAPVGEGLENGVSDGEREAYRFWRNHWGADVPPVDDAFQAGWDAAHLAAGYRKPTLPSVEDVADLIEPLVPVPATSPDGIWGHGQRLVAEQIATAIKAHLLDGGDRG